MLSFSECWGRKGEGQLTPDTTALMWATLFCLSLAVFAGCGSGGLRSKQQSLPVVHAAAFAVPRASVVVTIDHAGELGLGDEATTVNKIIAAAKEARDSVVLRAHRYANWMHVQWVLSALGEAGCDVVPCVVLVRNGKEATIPVTVYDGTWRERLGPLQKDLERHSPQIVLGIVTQPTAHGTEDVFHLNNIDSTVTRDGRAVVAWSKAHVQQHVKPEQRDVGVIEASASVTFESVAVGVAAMLDAGMERVEVGQEALHPWDRDQTVLPAPVGTDKIFRVFYTDLNFKSIVPLNLPIASMGEEDRDNDRDDRLIVSLSAKGTLFHLQDEITLAELEVLLTVAAQSYDTKMHAAGKQGFEQTLDGKRWSKLFVLLRADQDAPFQQVQWVLAELRHAGFYKLQFGVRVNKTRDRTQRELDRARAAWEVSCPVESLEGKLQCMLSTVGTEPNANYIDVSVTGAPDQAHLTKSVLQKKRSVGSKKQIGRVHAEPQARFAHVVETVNAINAAGITRVDLTESKRANEATRRASSLPR